MAKNQNKPKQPRTIFGTTENSNFILNMRSSTLQKWTAAVLVLCIVIPLVGGFIVTAANGSNALQAAFLYATGFACVLFFIIAMLKKETSFKENKVYWVVVFMAVWAFASYYGVIIRTSSDSRISESSISEYISTALQGELGRYEGLLALLAYFGIFLLASTVTRKKTVSLIMDILVGAGIVQAVIALLQHIPGFDFMTDYADLPTVALENVMLSSGLCGSPIIYGSFLTLVSGIAFAGAVFDSNIIRARVYGFSLLLFWLTGLFTSSIVPIIGIGSVFIIMTIITLTGRKNAVTFDKSAVKTPLARYGILAAGMIVILALVLIFQGIYIRDKAIAYYDAFYRLFIVVGYSPVNTQSLYEIGFERSMNFIKEHPLLGIGEDLMAKYQMLDSDLQVCMLDRSYNEYLYTAATRGIPALAGYIAFAAIVVKRSCKGVKEFVFGGKEWYRAALSASIAAYLVQAFFSMSAITVTPVFYLLCGLAMANYAKKESD
jgi:hypothetical protein